MKDATAKPVNRLAIGTAQFGLNYGVTNTSGQVPLSEVSRILERANELGIFVLDTASAYGDSEMVLGDAGTENFQVVTKIPSPPVGVDIEAQWVMDQAIRSATRLGRKNISTLLVHNPEDLRRASGKELIRGLIDSKLEGLIEKIGVSIYDPNDLEWISNLLELDVVQAPMNVFDKRMVASGWLDRLNNNGVETHVRSVFLQGALVAGVENLPNALKPWVGKFMEFETWAKSQGLSLVEAALLYPLSIPEVDKIVIGVVSVDQLEHAVIAAQKNPPDYPDFATNDQLLINPVNWHK